MIGTRKAWTALAVVALACGGAGGPDLEGTWQGEAPGGGEATWVFSEGGSLSWDVEGAPEGFFDDLTYDVVSSGDPMEIDIGGFGEGPMADQTLYCIAEHPAPDALRIDCEPGSEEEGPSRPEAFDEDALELTRVEADAGG
ncbi:MAG: hypothetical protein R3326_08510 [Gemmatimonadota bacterium]|nr:hypothetical protein [Gemmatimonadota bacterium]